MNYTIYWTRDAKSAFNENLSYLDNWWGFKVTEKFLDRIDEVLVLLSNKPEIYPIHREDDQVRKCVVNRNITLYFKIIDSDRIDLITFWNSNKNPAQLLL